MRARLRGILVLALQAAMAVVAAGIACAEADPGEEPAVRAVSKAMPAVVNINTERVVRRRVQDPMDSIFDQFFGGPMSPPREFRQKVQSLGSGFLIEPTGYIVTNEHVVERAADLKISVTTQDGKTYAARYVAGDAASDLALIKVDADGDFPFLSLDNLSPGLLGQSVLVLGNPMGYGSSVSRGVLSGTGRSVTIGDYEYSGLIQTDAAINPGNSGGPVIDLAGRLLGVSSVKMAYTPGGVPTQGIGFAIPGATVREKIRAMRSPAGLSGVGPQSRSPVERLFGMQVQDMTGDLADQLGYASETGALISEIENGSPAHRAGLRRGLVIRRLGRYEVNSAGDLERLLGKAERGTEADFVVAVVRRIGRRVYEQLETVTLKAR